MNMFSMMVKKGFQDSDKDNSGYIDWDELKGALIKLSKDLKLPTVTDDDVERYLAKLDIVKMVLLLKMNLENYSKRWLLLNERNNIK